MMKNEDKKEGGTRGRQAPASRSLEERLEEKIRAGLRGYVLDLSGKGAEVIVRSLPASEALSKAAGDITAKLRPVMGEGMPAAAGEVREHQACPKCGKPVGRKAQFCSSCGSPIRRGAAKRSPDCPSCGEKVSPQAKFCGSCGAPLR